MLYEDEEEMDEIELYHAKQEAPKIIMAAVVFAVIAVIAVVKGKDMLLNHYTDFYELEASDKGLKKGSYVELEVDCVLANYAEESSTRRFSFLIGKDQHFILWLENGDIISLEIHDKEEIAQLNKIRDDTMDYLADIRDGNPNASLTEKITVKGVISSMDSKLEDYYERALNEMGLSDSDSVIRHIELDASESRAVAFLCIVIVFAILIICILASVGVLKRIAPDKRG